MPAVIGVRETRRIRGVESLSVENLIAGKKSPRAVVRGASFPIDIHNPAGIGQVQSVVFEKTLLRIQPGDDHG
jgi:hypothetical protein